ncbi:hypothetical protein RCL_jg10055.t1 [Rhizophagus clarus]|uniref:Secreted protein n=1 Tax=Rhizophagus clarus TaxID=94130 RepID=A0A8H3QC98_9GLOM|nr:hypothetical protein RCL_jg10055.t1 [Rhizophagus clarus]
MLMLFLCFVTCRIAQQDRIVFRIEIEASVNIQDKKSNKSVEGRKRWKYFSFTHFPEGTKDDYENVVIQSHAA